MAGFTSKELDEEITWEEFRDKYLREFGGWVGKRPRTVRSWLYSLERYATGDH